MRDKIDAKWWPLRTYITIDSRAIKSIKKIRNCSWNDPSLKLHILWRFHSWNFYSWKCGKKKTGEKIPPRENDHYLFVSHFVVKNKKYCVSRLNQPTPRAILLIRRKWVKCFQPRFWKLCWRVQRRAEYTSFLYPLRLPPVYVGTYIANPSRKFFILPRARKWRTAFISNNKRISR